MTRTRIGEFRLAEVVGDWAAGSGPLHAQLAEALRSAIDRGDLRPGVVLPSERAIGRVLAVSRTTVVTSLETLKRIGYLDSQAGSGTWVRMVREFELAGGVTAPATSVGRNPLFRNLGNTDLDLVDFTAAVLDASPAVKESLAESFHSMGAHLRGPGYYPLGLPDLRRAVADRFTERGLATTADQVMITAGAQQAITIIAAAYVQPGDPVLVETPTYPGAIEAFRLLGGSTRTVSVGQEGLIADDVIREIEARPPKVLYLIPSFHNPTGTVMADVERKRLRKYLAGSGITIVEDESLVELSLNGTPGAHAFAGEDLNALSLLVGSASKAFWGGLRIGWIRAPAEVIETLSRHKLIFDLATPVPEQVATAQLLVRSEPILAERRRELTEKCHVLLALLADQLPEWSVIVPSGGVTAWVGLAGRSATEFSQLAVRHGVAVVASPFFDANGREDGYLRIPFVSDLDTLEQGVKRMSEAWRRMSPEHPGG